jgi:hypothetical protein
MLTIALAVLLSGAAFGLFMAVRHFMHKPLPPLAAALHGFFGATAIIILLLQVLATPGRPVLGYALTVLVGAAVLGFVNLTFHLRRRRHRSTLIVLHALVAVSGAGTLLYAILMR